MNTAQFIPETLSEIVADVVFTWKTPSNIALVKYWGKSNPQIPKNASISFSLKNCHTITTVEFSKKEIKKVVVDAFNRTTDINVANNYYPEKD